MKLCLGCMEQIEDSVTTCPHCGFNETTFQQESYYLTPGTIVGGKYILGKVLKYGGYTVTYIGMDAEKNQKVLVKEYLPSEFSTRSAGEKEVTIYSGDALEQFNQGLTTFLNEANRIQHLGNPQGIAKVYDCVAENDTGYVISEYVEGQTLQEMMEAKGKFSWKETKDFITQILTGLSQVHPLDIIHCDISPETIMLTSSGEVKLLDFGATRYVTTANSSSLAIILKQGFAPEEQYRSQGVRGPWTDVYALGAVMYYMITGNVPLESVDRALLDELKEPSKLGIEIPQNVENAMMNALNVYQKDRTPSAEAFLRELNSSEVKRIQVKQKRRETGKFPTWAKILVAGLSVVIVAGGAFVIHSQMQKQQQQSELGQGKEVQVMLPIIGFTPEEAENQLSETVSEYEELDIHWKDLGDFCFTTEDDNVGKIAWQSIPERGELKKGDIIQYKLGDNTQIHYSDINQYRDARILLKDMRLSVSKIGEGITEEEKAKGKAYGSLASITLKDSPEPIDISDIKDKEKQAEVIKRDNIAKISYYACDFFYTKKLKNYVGSSIYEVKMKKTSGGKKRAKVDKEQSVAEAGFVDDSYYTFHSPSDDGKYAGNVVYEQTKNSGGFNASEDTDVLFKVINKDGNLSGYIGRKTGGEVAKKIEDIMKRKVEIKCDNKSAKVTGVTITKKNDKNTQDASSQKDAPHLDAFSSNDENLVFTIEFQEPTPAPIAESTAAPAPAQKPATSTPKPTQKVPSKEKERGFQSLD